MKELFSQRTGNERRANYTEDPIDVLVRSANIKVLFLSVLSPFWKKRGRGRRRVNWTEEVCK